MCIIHATCKDCPLGNSECGKDLLLFEWRKHYFENHVRNNCSGPIWSIFGFAKIECPECKSFVQKQLDRLKEIQDGLIRA